MITPFSSFTDDSPASAFPAAAILFHADDYTAGATTWASRVGDLVLTLSAGAGKDSEGVYGDGVNISVSSVAGTMPVPAGYVVPFIIGKTRTNSATAGLLLTVGATTGDCLTATTVIQATNNGSELTNSASVTGSGSTLNALGCRLAYFDMVDTSSPNIFSVFANNLNESIGSATDTTITLLAIPTLALDNAFSVVPLNGTGHVGARAKVFGLFMFDDPLTMTDLKIAASEMARTQEVFAGWRNKS